MILFTINKVKDEDLSDVVFNHLYLTFLELSFIKNETSGIPETT